MLLGKAPAQDLDRGSRLARAHLKKQRQVGATLGHPNRVGLVFPQRAHYSSNQ